MDHPESLEGEATKYHIKLAMREAFYGWTATRVRNARVIDLGCGDGYGSALLADAAAAVVALDNDASLLGRAAKTTSQSRVSPICADCRRIPLRSNSLDAVVATALLEYIEDAASCIAESFRILKPGGIFACATTNSKLSLLRPDGRSFYREHTREFTSDELSRTLAPFSKDVRMFGATTKQPIHEGARNKGARSIERLLLALRVKQLIPIRLRNLMRRLVTGVDVEKAIAEGIGIDEGGEETSLYLIAWAVKT